MRGDTARTVTLLCITSLTVMAGATIAPSLPGIQAHFAANDNAALLTKLLLTIPSLAIALLAPAVGWLLDRYGRKRILLMAIGLYAVAGTSGLYLDSLAAILVGRTILGLAVAGTATSATTLLGDYFSGADRHRVLGMLGAAAAFGGVLFLLAGGLLAEISWRMPFLIYAFAIVLLPVAAYTIDEPDRSGTGDEGRGARVVGRAAGLVIMLYLVAFGVQVAFFSIPVQLPFYLQELAIVDPSRAGIALSVTTMAAAIVAALFRRIRAVLGPVTILAISLCALGVGFAMVSRAQSYGAIVAAMVVLGAAMGLNFPNLMGWLLARTPHQVRGRVVGGLNTSIFMGQFFSPIATHPLTSAHGLSVMYRSLGHVVLGGGIVFVIAALYHARARRKGANGAPRA